MLFSYHIAIADADGNLHGPREIERVQARDYCRRLDLFGRGLLEDLERTAADRGCSRYEGAGFVLQVQQVLQDE